MGIKAGKFEFGFDFFDKSESDFKALMKKHKVSAKNAKELYKEIQGQKPD